jgi:hypothetical protein
MSIYGLPQTAEDADEHFPLQLDNCPSSKATDLESSPNFPKLVASKSFAFGTPAMHVGRFTRCRNATGVDPLSSTSLTSIVSVNAI